MPWLSGPCPGEVLSQYYTERSISSTLSYPLQIYSLRDCPRTEATLAFLNWSAPASHSQSSQEAEATCFCHLVAEQPQNLGILLSPVFHYKVHQKHALEHFLLKALSSKGVDVDTPAALMFRDRKDSRDQRPLLYPLRIVRPFVEAAAVLGDDMEENTRKVKAHPAVRFWENSRLLRTGRTEESEQLPNQALKFIEDNNYKYVFNGNMFTHSSDQCTLQSKLCLMTCLDDQE